MKRRDLIKKIKAHAKANSLGYTEVEGGDHMKVTVGGRSTTVPRHREINEITAKAILKQIGAKP